MSTITEPTAPSSPNGAVAAPPTPLHPGPQMVPVDFTRLDPLPPPPRKENIAMIHVGTAVATLGSVVLVLSLFLVPWFSVREITITQQQGQSQGQGQTGNSQTTLNNRSRFGVMRDLDELGVASWASARREKRDGAIIALALLAQATVLVSSVSFRWRLFLSLGGGAALVGLLLTLLDFHSLPDLIRERLRTGSPFGGGFATNSSIVKIVDPQPGLGMTVLVIGAACVVLGAVIALMGGRRGKVIAPVAP